MLIEKVGAYFCDFGVRRKDFLNQTLKTETTKVKEGRINYIKMNDFMFLLDI